MRKHTKSSAFKTYCQKIATQLSSGEAREHAYRPALQEYIESFNSKLRVTNEPGKQGKSKKGATQNKPDFIVAKGQTPVGFIEAKDIGVNLDDVGKSDQIDRYCEAYPNLILTDYVEFRRYVKGELRGSPIRIGKVNGSKNTIGFLEAGEVQLTQFFNEFLVEEVESVSSPNELASRLALLARQLKKLVHRELEVEEDSVRLHKLMLAFKKVLLADLDVEKFSDMFAQTLAYGFFAARVHFDGKGEFSRRTASSILPKTNPFLRRIFSEFANENLPDSLIGVVDEIVDLLRKTNIQSVLLHFGEQGRQDPVVHFFESFLREYDPKLKKEKGVFYTPDPIVDYMVRSVDLILKGQFGRKKGLADEKTLLLDPALGTGSFLHKVIEVVHRNIPESSWDSYVGETLLNRVFGFEILMAPYAVAHLNLGLQLKETGYQFDREKRLGVYLTNTLEETAKRTEGLFADWLSEEADAASDVKNKKNPIMVVIGNPPYSADSQNSGEWIDGLLHGYDSLTNKKTESYFECDGRPLGERQARALLDDYVKFVRFAQWRVEQTGYGITAFITNHGFLDNPTFRGMRQSLMNDFDEIYLLDLHGNSDKKETTPEGGKDENVFSIKRGVCISFFVKKPGVKSEGLHKCKVFKADLFGLQDEKFEWLNKNDIQSTKFSEIVPQSPLYIFSKQDGALRAEYESGISVSEIFERSSVGVVTCRDALTVKFSKDVVWETVKRFSSLSESEARNEFDLGPDAMDWKVASAQKDLKQSGLTKEKIVPILYRPFDTRYTYYTGVNNGFLARPGAKVMKHMLSGENVGLITARSNKSKSQNHFFVSKTISEFKAGESTTNSCLFPLYIYEDGKRKNNIKESILKHAEHLVSGKNPEVELFNYMYAIVHSPEYRSRYKEFIRSEFVKIPFVSDRSLFKKLAEIGKELVSLHTLESPELDGGQLEFGPKGSNVIDVVKFDAKTGRLYINSAQYFSEMDFSVWSYEVGGHQVLCKWLKARKGHKLGHHEIAEFEKSVESIRRTLKLSLKIDKLIEDEFGWPLIGRNVVEIKKAA